jgi:hypothetical protein
MTREKTLHEPDWEPSAKWEEDLVNTAYKSLTVSSDKEKTRAFLADVFSKEGKPKTLEELL